MSWASNDCTSKKGRRNTAPAETAIQQIYDVARQFCDTITVLGPGDERCWALGAPWQLTTRTILNKLSGLPVTQFSGEQLWDVMERRDSWHAAASTQNKRLIGNFLWKIIQINLFPWMMRFALERQSTPDGQIKYRADFSFTNAELEHEMQKVARIQRAHSESDNES